MASPLHPDVVVNGETIPAQAIAAETQNHAAPRNKPRLAWQAAARALAVRALLLQESRRLELVPEPRILAPGRRETEEEALIRAVIEARIEAEPPTEAACRTHYESHCEHYRAPTLYEAAHILLAAPPGDAAARTEARAAASAILAVLARDPAAFDRLAATHSACPSREAGGRLGQTVSGDTVAEFEAALDRLEPGQIVPEPVESRYGVHVIRLDARAEGAILPFDMALPRIRALLEKASWAHGAQRLVADLLRDATISGIDFSKAA